jgi:hypothetical protein
LYVAPLFLLLTFRPIANEKNLRLPVWKVVRPGGPAFVRAEYLCSKTKSAGCSWLGYQSNQIYRSRSGGDACAASAYAKALHDVQAKGGEFKYLMVLDYRYTYDATEDMRRALLFMQSWARGTAAVMVGWWFPTGHLRVLGAHPSVGVQHLTHKKRVDFGVTSGVAYDYFPVSDGFSDADRGLLPLNVGSFDLNGGVRLKYFLRRRGYVGLTAKYHLINYANRGGTDLGGNAFTVDLAFGSH